MAFRTKMDIAQRAKQFAPFTALKGFEEALRAKEKIIVPKIELTEESMEDLNRKLLCIEKKDMITVVYYCQDEYVKVTGMVTRMDAYARILRVVNTKIPFADICSIEGKKFEE